MVTDLMQTAKSSSDSGSENRSDHRSTIDQCMKDLSVHGSPQTFETSSGGHIDCNGSKSHYHGATHWATILENVSGRGRRDCRDAADVL